VFQESSSDIAKYYSFLDKKPSGSFMLCLNWTLETPTKKYSGIMFL
jgi:hypothetical protein